MVRGKRLVESSYFASGLKESLRRARTFSKMFINEQFK
jgi:hypothetical protein